MFESVRNLVDAQQMLVPFLGSEEVWTLAPTEESGTLMNSPFKTLFCIYWHNIWGVISW